MGRKQWRALAAIANEKAGHGMDPLALGRAWSQLAARGLIRGGAKGWEFTKEGQQAIDRRTTGGRG